ncbi:MAG TPA: hypothetical protein VEX15_10125 [Nocardioidaceae bacterium]|nr:hypothetical protein [Nocardioidaceae bacterium]
MADRDRSGDIVWAVIAAALFGIPTLIIGSVTTGWADATDWMLEHHVVVPATAHPIVALPGAEGAGIDWPRIAIAAGALLVLTLTIRIVSGLVAAATSRRGFVERPGRRRRLDAG